MKAKVNEGPRLVVISPGYNVSKYLDLFINSLEVQNYNNWVAYLIDDASTDDTWNRLLELRKVDPARIVVMHNDSHKYQAKNWYDTIHSTVIKDDDIIVFIDMDDWFGTKYAFELTIKEYMYRDILCTTANNFSLNDYYSHPGVIFNNRSQLYESYHQFSLATYKASLFRKIPKHHFIDPATNEFYKVCGDYLITNPILWQAGPKHHQHVFVDNFIIYNNIRLENDDNKVNENGETLHSIASKTIHESFMKMVSNSELKFIE